MSEIQVNTINEYTSANGVTIDGVKLKDNAVETDTISEKTSAAGVTIDGVLIKDGNVDGVDVSAITQGVTMADSWRITSNFTLDSPNGVVDTNWERVDTDSYGTIGSAMTESSGIFTFPSTGIYKIDCTYTAITNGGEASFFLNLQTTTNNSSYNNASSQLNFVSGTANMYAGGFFSFIMDVTDTTTHKIRIQNGMITGTAPALVGDTNDTNTGLFFTRLGDT